MSNDHMGLHDAFQLVLGGQAVAVDVEIADLVLWMSALPGIETYTSCQGGSECCREEAFVGFKCSIAPSLQAIETLLNGQGYIDTNSDGDFTLFFVTADELKKFNSARFPNGLHLQANREGPPR